MERDLTGHRGAVRTETGLKKKKNHVFCLVSICCAEAIELQKPDVSMTYSYLNLQNNTINFGRIWTGLCDLQLTLQRVVHPLLYISIQKLGLD